MAAKLAVLAANAVRNWDLARVIELLEIHFLLESYRRLHRIDFKHTLQNIRTTCPSVP
jgi:hypothetical protein